jgi:hypothetical protein
MDSTPVTSTPQEVTVSWNKWVRRCHRWIAITFTVTVVVALVAVGQQDPAPWLFYLPLVPLVLLLATGLYLFVHPYASSWRSSRRAAAEAGPRFAR